MFLLPGVIITWYVTNTPIPPEYAIEIKRYLFARQHPEDGGWGLHIEGDSSVFGTAMNYTALRILGADADDKRMTQARAKLHSLGGAVYGPHWAKFWLSVLGVMEWDAVNPVPPELWYVLEGGRESDADKLEKAPSRLGSNCAVAMVDSHASSLSADVVRLFKKVDASIHPSYPPTATRTLHPAIQLHKFRLAP